MGPGMRKLLAFLLLFGLLALFPRPGRAELMEYTSDPIVRLVLSASDATTSVTKMRFSNDNQTWTTPEPFALAKETWNLTAYGGGPDEGIKCVYVQYKDESGNWSKPISACVNLDRTPPWGTIKIEPRDAEIPAPLFPDGGNR